MTMKVAYSTTNHFNLLVDNAVSEVLGGRLSQIPLLA